MSNTTTTAAPFQSEWQEAFVLTWIGVVILLLVKEVAPPDMLLMSAVLAFLIAKIITPDEAAAGFADKSLLQIMMLFMVAAGLRFTGALDYIRYFIDKIVIKKKGTRTMSFSRLLFFSLFPFTLVSGFINNTPLVAMLIPFCRDLSARLRVPLSKLLIPASYSVMAGGLITVIGTSTNLSVQSLAAKQKIDIALFDITPYGFAVVFASWLYLLLFADRLPDRQTTGDVIERTREYLGIVRVKRPDECGGPVPGSHIVTGDVCMDGKTVLAAGLKTLPGLYLVGIERGDRLIHAPGPDEVLCGEDRLFFAGNAESVAGLAQTAGLKIDESVRYHTHKRTGKYGLLFDIAGGYIEKRGLDMGTFHGEEILVEAVIGSKSPLVGLSVKETKFRAKYKAAIIAIHRHGEMLTQKIGTVVLQASDSLLLVTSKEFPKLYRDRTDFALVSPVAGYAPKRRSRALIAIALFVIMIVLAARKVTRFDNLFTTAMFAVGIMLMTRCLTAAEARESINLQVYIVIAAAIGISTAMNNSGAATLLANKFVSGAGGSELALQIMMYLGITFLTEIIANLPAVTLLCPVALKAAALQGSDPLLMAMIVMLAGSSSCMIATGYQTNLMVFAPGGYKFMDYVYFGTPYKVWIGFIGVLSVALHKIVWVWIVVLLVACLIVLFIRRKERVLDTYGAGKATPDGSSQAESTSVAGLLPLADLDRKESIKTAWNEDSTEKSEPTPTPDLGLETIATTQVQ